jgi:hypothetical protein
LRCQNGTCCVLSELRAMVVSVPSYAKFARIFHSLCGFN